MSATPPCLIAVMGCTGAGKSSFIQLITGANVEVGHTLSSATSEIASHDFQHRGTTITLVDTPGFDDSETSDRDILLKLLSWLKKTHDANHKLSGILYLHRIDAPRMQGSQLRNFGVFKQLCGEGFYKNVILATTCWDLLEADSSVGARREAQLRDRGGFWHALVLKGSQVCRVPRDRQAARELVYGLALRGTPSFLESQQEMGSLNLRPEQASALRAVDPLLAVVRQENVRALREWREECNQALWAREEQARVQREVARQQRESQLREQELERERILLLHRQRQEQQAAEMRALEAAMRHARIREAEELERERQATRKQLHAIQFKTDYVTLCRVVASGAIKVAIRSNVMVCAHCHRVLENEDFAECNKEACQIMGQNYRLCRGCNWIEVSFWEHRLTELRTVLGKFGTIGFRY